MTTKFRTILLTEDDLDIVSLMKPHFEEKGFEVTALHDGSLAAQKVKDQPFDAIILDVRLPGVNGLQVAAIARSSKVNSATPIFIVSGALDKDGLKRAASMGIVDVFMKPFEVEQLIERVIKRLDSKIKKNAYDMRIVNSFINATQSVLKYYFKTEPSLGKAAVKDSRIGLGSVTGLISLTGQTLKGSLSISCDSAFVIDLAKQLFEGQSVTLGDEMIGDIVGELCNQISGRVKSNFASLGLNISIGLPKVIIGEKHRIIHESGSPVVAIPIRLGTHSCSMEFTLANIEGEVINEKAPIDTLTEGALFFQE